MTAIDMPQPNKAKYFYVPEGRFILMSIVTLSFFEAYWMYKNWKYIKERDELDIMPFWRALFGVFFMHSLLNTLEDDNELKAVEAATFSGSHLATGWVIVMIIVNILAKFDESLASGLVLLFSVPSFLFLLPVQRYINRVNSLVVPQPNYSEWSFGQVLCLLVGVPVFALLILGTFIS